MLQLLPYFFGCQTYPLPTDILHWNVFKEQAYHLPIFFLAKVMKVNRLENSMIWVRFIKIYLLVVKADKRAEEEKRQREEEERQYREEEMRELAQRFDSSKFRSL